MLKCCCKLHADIIRSHIYASVGLYLFRYQSIFVVLCSQLSLGVTTVLGFDKKQMSK